jgi:hypothetical protein
MDAPSRPAKRFDNANPERNAPDDRAGHAGGSSACVELAGARVEEDRHVAVALEET